MQVPGETQSLPVRRQERLPLGFTLIELLVVIFVISVLVGILMPCLQGARRRAGAVACQAQLRQWNLAFKMYTDGNGGRWFVYDGLSNDTATGPWVKGTLPFWLNTAKVGDQNDLQSDFASCPMTGSKKDIPFFAGTSQVQVPGRATKSITLSYGFNFWLYSRGNASPRHGLASIPWMWGTSDVQGASRIPVLGDCLGGGSDPVDKEGPPWQEGHSYFGGTLGDYVTSGKKPVTTEWGGWCLNRHSGGLNMLFMDASVRKVGIKELWTLKWHRNFDTAGKWTTAGGVQPAAWPEWMRKFKDY